MNQNDILKKGVKYWNDWRKQNPEFSPSFRNCNFVATFPCKGNIYDLPSFENADFSKSDMNMIELRNGEYINCNFDNSHMSSSDLVDAYFNSCTFKNVEMRVAQIGSATFHNCVFENSDLSYCSAEDTDFTGSTFINCNLEHISFVSSNLNYTTMKDCRVYGISSWDLDLENSSQENLIITTNKQPIITVDNIELAQFMYLMINNQKLRKVIDTITSKVVLILGNFSPERKTILDRIRNELRKKDFVPIMFDFNQPTSRNVSETVFLLANMAKFVIIDLSSPRCTPHEMATIAKDLPSVNFYPLIVRGEQPYGMFSDFSAYKWIQQIQEYEKSEDISLILQKIIKAEVMHSAIL